MHQKRSYLALGAIFNCLKTKCPSKNLALWGKSLSIVGFMIQVYALNINKLHLIRLTTLMADELPFLKMSDNHLHKQIGKADVALL